MGHSRDLAGRGTHSTGFLNTPDDLLALDLTAARLGAAAGIGPLRVTLTADAAPDGAGRQEVLVGHRAERGREVTYRVPVAQATLSPAMLSRADELPKAEAGYPAISFPASGGNAARSSLR